MWSRTQDRKAQDLLDKLRQHDLTIVTAESCTAGLLAHVLSKADGAGDRLHGGFVTYTEDQKRRSLGIDPKALDEAGPVSVTVASQMASGALLKSAADIAVALTGVAGPKPDDHGTPVGTLYVAVAVSTLPTAVKRFQINASRERFYAAAVEHAIEMVVEHVRAGAAETARRNDRRLDKALTATFPASDPISL